MHFSAPALLAVLSATAVVAAPMPHDDKPSQYQQDCKKEFDYHWENNDWKKDEKLFYFDAEYYVKATPGQVVNNSNVATPGQPGARGIFKYGINVAENTICYNITLSGVTGAYMSPARTATHIHEAVKGASGPPRIAFPNPAGPDSRRVSYGCLTGPFKTGVNNTAGADQGDGFHVRQIVANPSGFFTDTHTASYVAGAVRGQLA